MQAAEIMLASSLRENYSMIRSADNLMKLYQEGLIPKARQDIQLSLSGYRDREGGSHNRHLPIEDPAGYRVIILESVGGAGKGHRPPGAIAGVTEVSSQDEKNEKN